MSYDRRAGALFGKTLFGNFQRAFQEWGELVSDELAETLRKAHWVLRYKGRETANAISYRVSFEDHRDHGEGHTRPSGPQGKDDILDVYLEWDGDQGVRVMARSDRKGLIFRGNFPDTAHYDHVALELAREIIGKMG